MRYVHLHSSIALIGAALGAASVGIAGFPGGSRASRRWRFIRAIFPAWTASPNCVRKSRTTFLRTASVRNCRPRHRRAQRADSDRQTARFIALKIRRSTPAVTGTTNFVETNPLPVTRPCSSAATSGLTFIARRATARLGDGNGITKKLGVMPAVANLHDKRIVEMTDGEIFNTITHGKGLMGAYGPLVPAQDRWAIIAYLRALQLSWLGSTNDLTPEQQAALK
jgi:hypothetical protein